MNSQSEPPIKSDEERLSRLQLALSENIGPASYHQLLEVYGSAAQAIAALPHLASKVSRGRQIKLCSSEHALQTVERTTELGGQILCLGDKAYPQLLAQTVNPPPILFAAGNMELLQLATCAIVGSRNSSANGNRFARQIAGELGQCGWKIASGLARGIDTAAHEASLAQGTIAVTATGLDVVYPPENTTLHGKIMSEGCIVSEMPPGTKPRADLFPRRNRIIAGLAAGVIVVEAALRSGSLITARLANDMGRDVFAVPGSPSDPRSAGTNKLIQDGAMLITSHREVAETLDHGHLYQNRDTTDVPAQPSTGVQTPPVSASQAREIDFACNDVLAVDDSHRQAVVELLGPDPVEIDVVIREAGFTPRLVQMIIIELDLAGRLERHTGQRVSLLV
jgi:DNA processing protein